MAVEVGMSGLSCQNCNEQAKIYRGCTSKPIQPFILDGKALSKCPIKLIWPETLWYIKMFSYYEDKFLPFPGTILQQPAILLDAFSIIRQRKEEIQDKITKKGIK